MLDTYKNKKEIKKLKTLLSQSNNQIDWESIASQLTFSSIDFLISKIKAFKKLQANWETNLKPKQVESLKNRISYLTSEIEKCKSVLDAEQSLFNSKDIKLLNSSESELIFFYENNKKWIERSYKNIARLQKELDDCSKSYNLLVNEQDGFIFDSSGKMVAKNSDLNDDIKNILNSLQANFSIELTKQKLINVLELAAYNEEEDDF